MKRNSYLLILLLSALLSCEKKPPMNPRMVNQVITGEVNGVSFKSGITVEMGAIVRKNLCNKEVVGMSLVRKIEDDKYQIVFLNYFHGKPGNYTLTDSTVCHRDNGECVLDSVGAYSAFKSYPGDDVAKDVYRLIEGPGNYLRILYYDPEKNEIQGEFSAKFVRTNKIQNAQEAVDTITYTNGKFFLANMYVQEVITEPR